MTLLSLLRRAIHLNQTITAQLTDAVGGRALGEINISWLSFRFQGFVRSSRSGHCSVADTHHRLVVSFGEILAFHHHQGFGLLGLG